MMNTNNYLCCKLVLEELYCKTPMIEFCDGYKLLSILQTCIIEIYCLLVLGIISFYLY